MSIMSRELGLQKLCDETQCRSAYVALWFSLVTFFVTLVICLAMSLTQQWHPVNIMFIPSCHCPTRNKMLSADMARIQV